MANEVRVWEVGGDELKEIVRSTLDLERRIHNWIEGDISVLDPELLSSARKSQRRLGNS